jgi:hypothetical protein
MGECPRLVPGGVMRAAPLSHRAAIRLRVIFYGGPRQGAWPVRRGAASRYVAAVNGGARVRSSWSGRMAKKRGMA